MQFQGNFKPEFLQRHEQILLSKQKLEEFKSTCQIPIIKSIRINTLKITIKDAKKLLEEQGLKLRQIPWEEAGFFVEVYPSDLSLGNMILHQLGYFYVQEAASMIPAVILNPKPEDFVLDAAASPGSKTSQMAAMMQNQGGIIANDKSYKRIPAMQANLQKLGVTNVAITNNDAKIFKTTKNTFDKILLDAPCSATGNLRKSDSAMKMWNVNGVRLLGGIQKSLLSSCIDALKQGGELVYSTCSLEPEENEQVIDFILQNKNVKLQKIDFPENKTSPTLEWDKQKLSPDIKNCLRIYPQDNNTCGFFIAKLTKLQ